MLKNNNTHWIFICGVSGDKSPLRHLMDVDFGFKVLKAKGVSVRDISILVDYEPSINETSYQQYGVSFLSEVTTKRIAEFNNVVTETRTDLENVAIIILGHGGHHGISSHSELKPVHIVNALNNKQNLVSAFVLFGQCYAGVYNYLNLDKLIDASSKYKLSFCGAAKFTPSYSHNISFTSINLSWDANYFILQFFLWILQGCVDIDGDDQHNLLDAFKFMSLTSGDKHTKNQVKSYFEIEPYIKEHEMLKIKSQNGNISNEEKIRLATLNAAIKELVQFISITPESWLLNIDMASEIKFQI